MYVQVGEKMCVIYKIYKKNNNDQQHTTPIYIHEACA